MHKTVYKLRYEDAAEKKTCTGWVCVHCHHFWGDDEKAARYCCHTDSPCACGGRKQRGRAACDDCYDRQRLELWQKRDRVDWDGETALVGQDDDRFFFGPDALRDYLCDLHDLDDDEKITAEHVEELRLCLCVENRPRYFDLKEYLADYLPDEDHGGGDLSIGWEEVEKSVNDWIEKSRPLSWTQGPVAVTTESVLRAIT